MTLIDEHLVRVWGRSGICKTKYDEERLSSLTPFLWLALPWWGVQLHAKQWIMFTPKNFHFFFYRSQFVFLMCGLAYNHQENDLAFLKNQEKRRVSHLSNYLDFQLGLKVGHKHGVWKSQKKSHLTLRAKRATFTFRVDKGNQKCQKWSILVRKTEDKNWSKMPKL